MNCDLNKMTRVYVVTMEFSFEKHSGWANESEIKKNNKKNVQLFCISNYDIILLEIIVFPVGPTESNK